MIFWQLPNFYSFLLRLQNYLGKKKEKDNLLCSSLKLLNIIITVPGTELNAMYCNGVHGSVWGSHHGTARQTEGGSEVWDRFIVSGRWSGITGYNLKSPTEFVWAWGLQLYFAGKIDSKTLK